MAPKRAKIQMGSSSQPDFDEGYDENKFVSSQAQVEYNKLRVRTIAKERGFNPTPGDGELMAMIEERGWQLICAEPESVPMSIVREFYANAKIAKNGYSYVRGITVDYRDSAIRAILGQPAMQEGDEDWVLKTRDDVDLDAIVVELCVPGAVWIYKEGTVEHQKFQATAMNRYARAWNLFICSNLMQSKHTHEIPVERAILLWGILNDKYVDLGNLIHRNMMKFIQGGTGASIPHASIVTRLCVASGVRWGGEEQLQLPTSAIDGATIEKMVEWPGGIPHHRGLGYIIQNAEEADAEGTDDEEQGEDEPPPPPRQQRAMRGARVARAGPSRPRHFMTEAQATRLTRRMTRRIDASHDMTNRRITDLAEALSRAYLDQGRQLHLPGIHTYGTYPPPDSPPDEGDSADQ